MGVVLAGGRSLRMGTDKALLAWHGRPLIEHQIALLQQAGFADVRVSGRVSGLRPGCAGVADAVAGAGPLGGLAGVATGLADGTDLLVVPVDMPLLTGTLLRRLWREQPRAATVRFAGTVLPMRWRLDAGSRARLWELLGNAARAGRSLRALQQVCGVAEIALAGPEADLLADCNDPAAWDALRRRADSCQP